MQDENVICMYTYFSVCKNACLHVFTQHFSAGLWASPPRGYDVESHSNTGPHHHRFNNIPLACVSPHSRAQSKHQLVKTPLIGGIINMLCRGRYMVWGWRRLSALG